MHLRILGSAEGRRGRAACCGLLAVLLVPAAAQGFTPASSILARPGLHDLPGTQAPVLTYPLVSNTPGPAAPDHAGQQDLWDLESCLSPAGLEVDGIDAVSAEAAAVDPGSVTVELPPPPDGRALVLTGLLTMGGWRLGRQARHIHLAPLPEWYHEGAPEQIGHAVVAPVDLDVHLLPLNWLDNLGGIPAGDGSDALSPSATRLRWLGPCLRLRSQLFTPVAGPRSPPLFPRVQSTYPVV